MSSAIRLADADDLERLLPRIREFWKLEKLEFDSVDMRAILGALLLNASLGCVFVAEAAGQIVGYAVVTFGYSLEHGGRDGLLDELYVRAELRGSKIGTRLVEQAVETCRQRGVTRLHLEVDNTNPGARRLYEQLGFASNDRSLLTKKL